MTRSAIRDRSDEAGFSLVEILVAMVLLAILGLSFLPLVVQALRTSASSTTLTTATRMVSEQMETTRATTGACAAFASRDLNSGVARSLTDPRGVALVVRSDMGTCPTAGGVMRYTVWVTKSSTPSVRLAEAVTLIAVDPT